MGDLVFLDAPTRLDRDPNRVLDGARDHGMQSVVIMGYDERGEEYFASSIADGGTVLWLIERLKLKLLSIQTTGD